jgi:prolycopene isomerase
MGRIVRDRLVKDHYDVVVVGAGLGGLAAGSLLAKRGVGVLVVEQHSIPGGACTSFRREGRVYDSGAALIFGFGKEGYNIHHTLVNSLEEEITVIAREKFFRLDFAGQPIEVWKDLDRFLPEVEKLFPSEKDEIRKLYAFLVGFYERDIKGQNLVTPPSEMSDREKRKMLSNPLRLLRLRKVLGQSAADFMGPYLKSRRLLEFYDKLCASYAYITMKETPAMMALTMFTDNHAGGTYYVAQSAQTYSNILEKSIESNGGTMLYNSKVDGIVFEGGKACGVRLEDGLKIGADRVISNTTVWNLYHDLIPQGLVKEYQLRWADSLIPTYPAMVLYAAVDKSVFPSDINPVEYYISETSKIDTGDITLYIPTVDDHSLGPEGEHIITIFSPAPNQKWPRPYEEEYRSPSYQKRKEKQAELILEDIERRIPNFRKGIKRLYIATPSTIERYTLKTWGCVGGPKQMMGQELTKRLHAKTDWPGLYACGDSTTLGMGTPAVVASGFGAANVILREMGKEEYASRKFERECVTYVKENPRQEVPVEIASKPKNASIIARQCQYCEDQPCRPECPAGIDIAGFIRRIEAGNFTGAARLIRETNPFAEVCGYVCDAKGLCEKVCVRADFATEPVRIKELHRWVSEHAGEGGWEKALPPPNGMKVCVLGGGACGLTCAHYLARLGYEVTLMDRESAPGGGLKELVQAGSLPEGVLRRELGGMMLPTIGFAGNRTVSSPEEVARLGKEYAAVFVTFSLRLETEGSRVKGMPNVFVGGRAYSGGGDAYALAHAVRDGRNGASLIDAALR